MKRTQSPATAPRGIRTSVAITCCALALAACTEPDRVVAAAAAPEPASAAATAPALEPVPDRPFDTPDHVDSPHAITLATAPLLVVTVGQACTPSCTGKQCGPDGCGGVCGSCVNYLGKPFCDSAGQCVAQNPCVRKCTDKECGPDGCGGFCGQCPIGKGCVLDYCAILEPSLSCEGRCGSLAPGGCSCRAGCAEEGATGNCCEDIAAACACVPTCGGKTCGSDGCGGSCGTCAAGSDCVAGACVDDPCLPDPCSGHGTCQGGVCDCAVGFAGTACDACGPNLRDYPQCSVDLCANQICNLRGTCDPTNGQCVCTPPWNGATCGDCAQACSGKACGDDGCGGVCGTCATHGTCDASQQCACEAGWGGSACETCAVTVAAGFSPTPTLTFVPAGQPVAITDPFDGSVLDANRWEAGSYLGGAFTVSGGALTISTDATATTADQAAFNMRPRRNALGETPSFTGALSFSMPFTWGPNAASIEVQFYDAVGQSHLGVRLDKRAAGEDSFDVYASEGVPSQSVTFPTSGVLRFAFSPVTHAATVALDDSVGNVVAEQVIANVGELLAFTFSIDVRSDAGPNLQIVTISGIQSNLSFADPAHWRLSGSALTYQGVDYGNLPFGDELERGLTTLSGASVEPEGVLVDGGPFIGFDGLAPVVNAAVVTADFQPLLHFTIVTPLTESEMASWVADVIVTEGLDVTLDHFQPLFSRNPNGSYSFVPLCGP